MFKISVFAILTLLLFLKCAGQESDTRKIQNLSLDLNGNLRWTVDLPADSLCLQIESFEANKWQIIYQTRSIPLISIGAKEGAGKQSARINLHPGLNRIRVKVTCPYTETSKEIEIYNPDPDIETDTPFVIVNHIVFSDTVTFEVFNKHHKSIVKGRGIFIDMSDYKKGTYYLQIGSEKKWLKILKTKQAYFRRKNH